MGFLIFLLMLYAPAVLCFPMVKDDVPPQCVDPSFACQDLESARLCGVVKSCVHDIWSTMNAPDDNEDICELCKEMVKEARDQLLSNMTQEEIKEVFEGSCKLLPVKFIADECIKVVDGFIPELVEMLASRMDPNMVCTVSGLCNIADFPLHGIYKTLMSIVSNKYQHFWNCDYCTMQLSNVKKLVSETPKDKFRHYIDEFVQLLKPGDGSKEILHYTDSIHMFLSTMRPKAMCAAVKVCPISCEGSNNLNDELVCEFCTNVLHHIQDLITTNTTVEEFREALLNFCNVTGKFSEKCTTLVNDYFDTVFNFIKSLNSKTFCTLIGLCGNTVCSHTPLIKLVPATPTEKRITTNKLIPSDLCGEGNCLQAPMIKLVPATSTEKRISAVKLTPSFPIKGNEDESESDNEIFGNSKYPLPAEHLIGSTLLSQESLECNFCKGISIYLETDLKLKSTKDFENSIDKTLHEVCNKWGYEYLDYCQVFLSKYYLRMRQSILENNGATLMCDHIKACPFEEKPGIGVKVITAYPMCDMCKAACDEIENMLKDPSTKKSLETMLYQICSYLPKPLQNDCHSFIDNNIESVLKIVEENLDGDKLCPATHLCPASVLKVMSNPIKDVECDICKDLVQQFKEKVQDPETKNEIKQFLERGCTLLPTEISNQCKDFIDQNIDSIITIVVQELDPNNVCSALEFCPGSAFSTSLRLEDAGIFKCDVCINAIQRISDMLKTDAVEVKIQEALNKLCIYFPEKSGNKCLKYINSYAKTLIKLLAEDINPNVFCNDIHFCPASKSIKKSQSVSSDVECELCKEIIKKVDEELKEKSTEDEIRAALDKVCSYLPTKFSAKCKTFMDTYSETLITILAEEMDPNLVCSAAHVCTASKNIKKPPRINNDIECDLCKDIIKKVDEELTDKSTEDEIRAALDKVCSHLPTKFSVKCKAFIDTYSETLITILAEEMDPDVVCSSVHVCPVKQELLKRRKSQAQDLECEGCQYIFHFVQERLMNSSVQQEIKDLVEKVCNHLPDIYSKNCDAFIEEFGNSLLVILAHDLDPSIMCTKLHACPSSLNKHTNKKNDLNFLKSTECEMCTTVVDYLDKLLEEDDVDKEITALVEKACSIVPSLHEKCSMLVETYGPYILQMIGQLADSKQVCQEIDMCPHTPGHVHLLGGKKCTFGPSYWCQSQVHAAACKAEVYCKKKNWSV